jgi:hypothetical protein
MYDLRLQFAAEVCVFGRGVTTCLSSLDAALAAHIIHECHVWEGFGEAFEAAV